MGKKHSKLSTKKQSKQLLKRYASIGNDNVNFICLDCGVKENISSDAVVFLYGMDVNIDPTNASQFRYKEYAREMYPEYYKNTLGYEIKISDR